MVTQTRINATMSPIIMPVQLSQRSSLSTGRTSVRNNRMMSTRTLGAEEVRSRITNDLGDLERLIHRRRRSINEDNDRSSSSTELEKLNFQMWLLKKKRQDLENKKKHQDNGKVEELKILEKEKKQLENQLNFHLWVKRKEEEDLKKKINEHQNKIKVLEGKHQRLEANKSAFTDWLHHAKNRQKPIPPNQGLQSLCAKSSVSYINPKPWQFE